MKLLTIKEISEKWGLSERMIRKLCVEDRIPEAELIRGIWMIPEDAYKPERKPPQKQEKQTVPLSPLARQVISQRRRNNHYGIYEHIQVYLTYSSNRMASNRLTKKAVEEIYRKNNITTSFEPAKVDDIIETINHFEAVRYIVDNIEAELTPVFIQHLHQILTYGTYADRKAKLQPGVFRADDSKKGIVPTKISKELISLCKTYEKNPATIERILDFHVRFEKIHPFKDYNGRIGRLIMMKECLRHGIAPFIIDDKSRSLYQYGILAWSQDHVPMLSLVESAQERFQAKIELCRLFKYAREPEEFEEDTW